MTPGDPEVLTYIHGSILAIDQFTGSDPYAVVDHERVRRFLDSDLRVLRGVAETELGMEDPSSHREAAGERAQPEMSTPMLTSSSAEAAEQRVRATAPQQPRSVKRDSRLTRTRAPHRDGSHPGSRGSLER